MALGNRRQLVHAPIQRRGAGRSGPELDRRIENQPHHVAIFALELANHELAAASGSLPGDALEGIAAHVLAQLVELGARARTPFGGAGLGGEPRASSARGRHERSRRTREHLDADGIGEGQRHLEEPGGPSTSSASPWMQ